jgi:hypothetical protein
LLLLAVINLLTASGCVIREGHDDDEYHHWRGDHHEDHHEGHWDHDDDR